MLFLKLCWRIHYLLVRILCLDRSRCFLPRLSHAYVVKKAAPFSVEKICFLLSAGLSVLTRDYCLTFASKAQKVVQAKRQPLPNESLLTGPWR